MGAAARATELRDATVLADGLAFPEGPVVLPDGSVLVGEIAAGRLSVVSAAGRRTTLAHVGGGPNGAALGPDEHVYVCNNGGNMSAPADQIRPAIQRVCLATGRVEVLYDRCDGEAFGALNDLVVDHHGGIWFTESRRFTTDGHAYAGAVYYASADGSAVRRVVDDVEGANGIGLSPDGATLYWAQTRDRMVMRRRVEAPGRLAPTVGISLRSLASSGEFDRSVVLASLPGLAYLDSLAVDAHGNVCVATLVDAGITVVAPDAASIETYVLPDALHDPFTTNICFGGAAMTTAYITLSGTGRLVRCAWPTPGLVLAHQRVSADGS